MGKKMRWSAVLCLALGLSISLSACGTQQEEHSTQSVVSSQEVPSQPEEPAVEEPVEPVVMYAGTLEDHLLPLEDYSWARECAPEQ